MENYELYEHNLHLLISVYGNITEELIEFLNNSIESGYRVHRAEELSNLLSELKKAREDIDKKYL